MQNPGIHKTNWIQICILTSSLGLQLHNEFFKVLLGSREDGNNSGLCPSPDEECQKISQKKNNAKSCKRTKSAAEPTEGRDLHNHKSTEGFRQKRGFGLSDTRWMEFG